MTAVKVTGLVKRFGRMVAVDGVGFEAEAGKFTTLLGPSGCGKTTLLRSIAGLERPDRGRIEIGDRVVCSDRGEWVEPEDRNVGMVFQSYALWPHMTVLENVTFPLECEPEGAGARRDRERAMAALELVRLGGLERRYPAELSGGQQQRVALARAIVYDPLVLLLDEPLANLDAKLREEMRVELKQLQRRTGITTIYVTHDQDEAMVLSDTLILMNHGRIVQQGTADELYEQPADEFVAGFLGVSNLIPGSVAQTGDGELGLVETADGLATRCPIPEGFQRGEPVLLCLRPENVVAQTRRPAEGPAWEAEVEATAYLGSRVELLVSVGDRRLRVLGHPTLRPAPGTRLYLHVSPEHVRLIRRPPGGP